MESARDLNNTPEVLPESWRKFEELPMQYRFVNELWGNSKRY